MVPGEKIRAERRAERRVAELRRVAPCGMPCAPCGAVWHAARMRADVGLHRACIGAYIGLTYAYVGLMRSSNKQTNTNKQT